MKTFYSMVIGILLVFAFPAPSWGQKKSSTPEQMLTDGLALIQQRTPESFRAAIVKVEPALNVFRTRDSQGNVATACIILGSAYTGLKERAKGNEYFLEALTALRGQSDVESSATILEFIASNYIFLGEQKKALDYLEQAIEAFDKTGNSGKSRETLGTMSELAENSGDIENAVAYRKRLAERLKGEAQATEFEQIANLYIKIEKNDLSFKALEQALEGYRAAQNRKFQARVLSKMGACDFGRGNKETGKKFLIEAFNLSRADGDNQGMKNASAIASLLDRPLSDEMATLAEADEALLKAQTEAGPRGGGNVTLEALAKLLTAADQYQAVGDTDYEVKALRLWVNACRNETCLEKAIELQERALAVYMRNTQYNLLAGDLLKTLGDLYVRARNKPKALAAYQKALEAYRANSNGGGQEAVYNALAIARQLP